MGRCYSQGVSLLKICRAFNGSGVSDGVIHSNFSAFTGNVDGSTYVYGSGLAYTCSLDDVVHALGLLVSDLIITNNLLAIRFVCPNHCFDGKPNKHTHLAFSN